MLYDPKLEQWGIAAKGPDEGITQYIRRIFQSQLFRPGFRDICLHSLSTTGAREENAWVTTLPNVFYYSFSNKDTVRSLGLLFRSVQLPNVLSMLIPLQPLAVFLGGSFATDNGFSDQWQVNDGVVNTVSMTSDGRTQAVQFSGQSSLGQWHHMGEFDQMDHEAIVGVKLVRDAFFVYERHAALLRNLPTAETNARRLQLGETPVHTAPEEITSGLQRALEEVNKMVVDDASIQKFCAETQVEAAQRYCSEHHKPKSKRLRA